MVAAWRPERRVGPVGRLGAEKRDNAWEKVKRVDVEGLLGGPGEAGVDEVEKLEDACEALVPTLICVDEDADPQVEIQRLVRLAQVLQLGYERARFELDEETTARQLEAAQAQAERQLGGVGSTGRSSFDEEEMERLYEDLRATNEELKESYATLDARDEEVQELRVELDRLQAEIPDTELGHAIEAAESELYEERKRKERLEKEVQELEEMIGKSRESIESLQIELTEERARSNDLEGKLRSIDDDVIELRAQLAAEQKKVGNQSKDEREIAEQLSRANKEVDRLLRENRQLDADNTEVRNKNSELASEMMQMSEKIIILDEEKQTARQGEVDLAKEKRALETIQASTQEDMATLQAQLDDKQALLREFEDRFSRQYYEWEETRQGLKSALEKAKQERDKFAYELNISLNGVGASTEGAAGAADALGDAGDAELLASRGKGGRPGDLRAALLQLAEAEEKVSILVEAYEDLEKSNQSDIDAAIERERRTIDQLKAEKEHREKDLKAERVRSKQVEDDLAELQREMEDAQEQMHKYEREYGLEEAIADIKRLKREQRDRDGRLATMMKRLHRADITIEDLYERNQEIKRMAGLPDDVDAGMDFKLRGRVERAQLRAFNAQLEKEVGELEEERRRLRSELRFRTKWQGEHAAKLGLSGAQLSLLEEYADAMRFGDQQGAPRESRTVVQLEEQVKALQERLASSGAGGGQDARAGATPMSESDLFRVEMTKSIDATPAMAAASYRVHEQLSLTATQNRRMADSIHALRAQVKQLTLVNNQVKRTVYQALEHATGFRPKPTAHAHQVTAAAASPLAEKGTRAGTSPSEAPVSADAAERAGAGHPAPSTVASIDVGSLARATAQQREATAARAAAGSHPSLELLQSLLDVLSDGDAVAAGGATRTPTSVGPRDDNLDGTLAGAGGAADDAEKALSDSTEVELRQQIVELSHELTRQSTIISEHEVEMQRIANAASRRERSLSSTSGDAAHASITTDRSRGGGRSHAADDADGDEAHQQYLAGDGRSQAFFGRTPSDVASLGEEVVRCLEELEYKNALLQSVRNDNEAYHVRMEELLDTRNLLYREHLRLRHEWNVEKSASAGQLKQLEDKLEEMKVKYECAMRMVDTIGGADASDSDFENTTAGDTGGDEGASSAVGLDAMKDRLKSSMMRESVLRVKELRLTRALESALNTESVLIAAKREAEQGMAGIVRSLRSRLMEAERGKSDSDRRVAVLTAQALEMVDGEHHRILVEEHKALQLAFYALVSERAESDAKYVGNTKDVERLLALENENECLKADVLKMQDTNGSLSRRITDTEAMLATMTGDGLDGNRREMSNASDQIISSVDELGGTRGAAAATEERGARSMSASLPGVPATSPVHERSGAGAGAGTAAIADRFIALQEELMELRLKDANASRRVEMGVREAERLNATASEQKERVAELERSNADLHRQLHAMQEAESQARERLGACVDASTVAGMETKARGLQDRLASIFEELSRTRSRAEESEMRESESMTRHVIRQTEVNELRAAVRELQQTSDLRAVCGRLHEELISSKTRVSSARNQVESFQVYADRVSDENVHLRSMLHERETELFENKAELKASKARDAAVITRLEGALRGERCVGGPDTLREWAASMRHLKERNESLFESCDAARCRAHELQAEVDAMQMRMATAEQIDVLMGDSVPEAYRRNVQLSEELLQSRLAAARSERERKLVSERTALMESQLREAEDAHISVVEEKLRALASADNQRFEHTRQLQQLKEQLKEARANSAYIRTEYLKKVNALNRQRQPMLGINRASGEFETNANADHPSSSGAGLATGMGISVSNRDVELRHIEEVRQLKLENADVNFKLAEASGELFECKKVLERVSLERDSLIARMEDRAKMELGGAAAGEDASGGLSMSDLGGAAAATSQAVPGASAMAQAQSMKKVMDLTVTRLEKKIASQEQTIASFRELLSKTRSESLAQLKKDHTEIERLSEAMYCRNANSIAEMKHAGSAASSASLQQGGAGAGGGGSPDPCVSSEKENQLISGAGASSSSLRGLLREREEHIRVLQSKLEQAAELAGIVEEKNGAEVRGLEEEVRALKLRLHDAMEGTSARVVDSERSSLRAVIVEKNKKLKDFSRTIEVLEKKLVESMKQNADRVIAGADSRLADQTLNKVTSLEQQVRTLQKRLRAARTSSEVAGSGGIGADGDGREEGETVQQGRGRRPASSTGAILEADRLRTEVTRLRRENERYHDDLAKERERTRELRKRPGRAMPSPAMSAATGRKTDEDAITMRKLQTRTAEMESRCAVLEAQNLKLRSMIASEEGPLTDALAEMDLQQPIPHSSCVRGAATKDESVQTVSPDGSFFSGIPGLEKWEREKKLGRRVETLRAQLTDARKELDTMREKYDRASASAKAIQEDRLNLQNSVKAMQAEMHKLAAGRTLGSPGQLRALSNEADSLREKAERQEVELEKRRSEVDQMKRASRRMEDELAAMRQEKESTPPVATVTTEAAATGGTSATEVQAFAEAGLSHPDEDANVAVKLRERILHLEDEVMRLESGILAIRIEKEQSTQTIGSLKRRLMEWFKDDLTEPVPTSRPTPAGSRSAAIGGPSLSSSSAILVPSGSKEERDLKQLVASLQKIIEKMRVENEALKGQGASNVKYMEVVNRNKALKRAMAEQKEALEAQRRDSAKEFMQQLRGMESTIKALRNQIKRDDRAGSDASKGSIKAPDGNERKYEALLEEKNDHVARLLARIEEVESEGRSLRSTCEDGRAETASLRERATEAERRRFELERENRDLKTELGALDPAFFEEVEDLKFQHQKKTATIGRYEAILREWAHELGRQYPFDVEQG